MQQSSPGATLSDDAPQAVGTAAAGSGTGVSRADHVHADTIASIKTRAAAAATGLRPARQIYNVSENVYLFGATVGTYVHSIVHAYALPTNNLILRNTSTNLNDEANFPVDLEGGTYTITVCLTNANAASNWAYNLDAAAAFVTVVGDATVIHTVTTAGVAIAAGVHTLHIKNVLDTGAGEAEFYSVIFERTGA